MRYAVNISHKQWVDNKYVGYTPNIVKPVKTLTQAKYYMATVDNSLQDVFVIDTMSNKVICWHKPKGVN